VSASSTVRIGIAGWSYEDWKGVVYPKGCRDTLRFCAELVDCIEINTSFYRIPEPRTCASWLSRTADLPMFFTAKLPQTFTHDLAIEAEDVAKLHAAFAPLAGAEKLRVLLAQFNYRFAASEEHRGHLATLVEAVGDIAPVAVELRHRSWAEPDALQWLKELDVSVVHLDYPGVGSGFALYRTELLGPAGIAYLRLHGRNFDAWFKKGAGRDEVYDYDYSKEEVAQVHRRIGEISAGARETVVIANNHFHGQAMRTALELTALWAQHEVRVPEPLLSAFPSLAAIAAGRAGQRGLFDP
jgi:uncharacterized protein YecE (DUF72 family)